MNSVVAWAQVLATVAIVLTFIVYWRQLVAMQGQLKAGRDSSRTQNLLSIIDYIQRPEHRKARFTLINLQEKGIADWTLEDRVEAERACSCWDTVALILRNTDIPGATDLIVKHWKYSIRSCYIAASTLMEENRKVRDVDFWEDFKWLGLLAIKEATIKDDVSQQVAAAESATPCGLGTTSSDKINLCDYVVAFVDLLGQKAEMPGRHLPESEEEAVALVKKSVGKIVGTQKLFESFYESYSSGKCLYAQLPKHIQDQVPDMAPGELNRQFFSDGMVLYIPLGQGAIKSPINSIFGLLIASGMLCATGLAAKGPLRIGIDVAWAVEYRPGELYGCALAHAYKLENEVAKWPRVVIGEGLQGYLQHYVESAGPDISEQFRKEIATLCQGMISTDVDGQAFLHYLGSGFNQSASAGMESDVIYQAKQFIDAQVKKWEQEKNSVLAERYRVVRQYYEQHRPNIEGNGA